MRSMQWKLAVLGTISAFAFRHRETKKILCRGGRSQDLPDTDFQPAIGQLNYYDTGGGGGVVVVGGGGGDILQKNAETEHSF